MGVAVIIVALAVGIVASQPSGDGKQLELVHVVSWNCLIKKLPSEKLSHFTPDILNNVF